MRAGHFRRLYDVLRSVPLTRGGYSRRQRHDIMPRFYIPTSFERSFRSRKDSQLGRLEVTAHQVTKDETLALQNWNKGTFEKL